MADLEEVGKLVLPKKCEKEDLKKIFEIVVRDDDFQTKNGFTNYFLEQM